MRENPFEVAFEEELARKKIHSLTVDLDFDYSKKARNLVEFYRKEGFHKPEYYLEAEINASMEDGKTKKQAIDELCERAEETLHKKVELTRLKEKTMKAICESVDAAHYAKANTLVESYREDFAHPELKMDSTLKSELLAASAASIHA